MLRGFRERGVAEIASSPLLEACASHKGAGRRPCPLKKQKYNRTSLSVGVKYWFSHAVAVQLTPQYLFPSRYSHLFHSTILRMACLVAGEICYVPVFAPYYCFSLAVLTLREGQQVRHSLVIFLAGLSNSRKSLFPGRESARNSCASSGQNCPAKTQYRS